MSPESFTFTLTVPGDPRLVGVVRDLCAHAAEYARLQDPDRSTFCDRVSRAVEEAVAAEPNTPRALVFDCSDGHLRVTVAGQTLVQVLTQ